MVALESARHRDEPAIGLARLRGHDAFEVGQIANRRHDRDNPERCGGSLERLDIDFVIGRGRWIVEDRDTGDAWRDLLQKLNVFPGDRAFQIHEPGDVTARPRKACYEALANWIDEVPENDGNGAGFLLQNLYRRRARCKDDIRLGRNDLLGQPLKQIHVRSAPSIIDAEVSALYPTSLLQTLTKRRDPMLILRIVLGGLHQHGELAHSFLSARRKRPPCRAAEQSDELAPSHELLSDEAHSLTHHLTMSALCTAAKSSRLCR